MASPHIHIPYDRLREYGGFIRDKALDLEIYFSADMLDKLSADEIAGLKQTLDYNPSLSFHAPFMDLSPGAVDSRVREATMQRFSHILDIAGILRPKAIVFHSGYEKWRYAFNIDLWLEKSLQTWQPLNERASQMGVRIAIENIFEDEPSNLKLLMERMSSSNFGICFDTGHFNLFSKVSIVEWMEALGNFVIELHLHDNNRTFDEHLPMGEGSFDFKGFFGLLQNRDCIYTIEAHSPEKVMRSMEFLEKIGR
ncbi:MAG: sugar phosphate isomerase/epimerase [Nitrospirae bacterium]|nr:sugar phosphate isomerase/epimerase [Nitrospirota bacterium]